MGVDPLIGIEDLMYLVDYRGDEGFHIELDFQSLGKYEESGETMKVISSQCG